MMKTIILLLLAFTIQAQGQSCQVQRANDSNGDPRALRVNFPDGRKLTVVGHVHGLRSNQREVLKETQSVEQLNDIMNRYDVKLALKYYNEDLKILKSIIAEGAQQPQFVAVEMSQQTLQGLATDVRNSDVKLYQASMSQGTVGYSLFDQASLFSSGGAALYLYNRQPQLFTNTQLLALEDDKLISQDEQNSTKVQESYDQLIQQAQGDEAFLKVLPQIVTGFLMNDYPAFNFNDSMAARQFVQKGLANIPVKYQASMQSLLVNYVNYFYSLNNRDNLTAYRMVMQNKSGVVFVGTAHLLSIANKIQQMCKAINEKYIEPYQFNNTQPNNTPISI